MRCFAIEDNGRIKINILQQEDFYFCVQVDKFDFVMKQNGDIIEKIGYVDFKHYVEEIRETFEK